MTQPPTLVHPGANLHSPRRSAQAQGKAPRSDFCRFAQTLQWPAHRLLLLLLWGQTGPGPRTGQDGLRLTGGDPALPARPVLHPQPRFGAAPGVRPPPSKVSISPSGLSRSGLCHPAGLGGWGLAPCRGTGGEKESSVFPASRLSPGCLTSAPLPSAGTPYPPPHAAPHPAPGSSLASCPRTKNVRGGCRKHSLIARDQDSSAGPELSFQTMCAPRAMPA